MKQPSGDMGDHPMSGTTPRAGLSEGGLTDTERCEHGVEYADECAVCDFEITEAQNAGAWTPKEIGLYWKGRNAGRADLAAKVEALCNEATTSANEFGKRTFVLDVDEFRAVLAVDSTPREAPVPQRDGGEVDLTDEQAKRILDDLRDHQFTVAEALPQRDGGVREAVLALHRPWYEVNGVRHDHTVLATGDDVPADHVCRIGPEHQSCHTYEGAPEETEHEVLACVECRQVTDDGEVGYLFWPCATVRAVEAVESAPATREAEPEPRAGADHDEWSIRIYEDQPIPEGKKYAPDSRVVILRDGEQVREFLYPGYRIYTLLAHWTEGLADLAAELDRARGDERGGDRG